MPPRRRVCSMGLVAAVGLVSLVGCGSDGSASDAGGGGGGALRVEASFYPLQWAAERVGGRRVTVTNLTPPGAEPHDLELTPRSTAALADADLVVYLSGFQPAVDDALSTVDARALDVADHVDLDLAGSGDEDRDPHFWLDPTRLASVVDAIATALSEIDPDHEDGYRAGAAEAAADLEALDADLEAGLADCDSRDLVTSHEAFGYLAQRYRMEQVGLSGFSPDQEPSAADLAALIDLVEERDVRTIYFETLTSSAVAETVASETGARTAVLDPIEGLTDASEGADYLEVMRANLASLRAGQPCP